MLKKLFYSFGLTIIIVLLSTWGSISEPIKYASFIKPPLSPPSWIFGPTWSFLYLLAAYALFRVLNAGGDKLKTNDALFSYYTQLFINSLWTYIFFVFDLKLLGSIWVLLLIYFVYLTYRKFKRLDKTAAYLLIPYFAWLLFATYLSFGVWYLNK